ncbi:hypothetical protein HBH55_210630 [Parastagonospora nodorum]|nr:hypothetical protein HBH55_210630 [Parastagonospora nodorum]
MPHISFARTSIHNKTPDIRPQTPPILNAEFVNMVMGMGHEELSAKFFDPSLLIPSFLQYHHGLDPNDSYATSPTPFYQNTPLPVVAT